jgi:glycerol uptake facilitator protein
MPFGWIALGFGQAFVFPIMVLGKVSAHLNPATCLGLWVIGTPCFSAQRA